MESEEGESYRLHEAVVTEGPAEEWMTTVDEAMKASLYGIAKEGVFMYGCKQRSALSHVASACSQAPLPFMAFKNSTSA